MTESPTSTQEGPLFVRALVEVCETGGRDTEWYLFQGETFYVSLGLLKERKNTHTNRKSLCVSSQCVSKISLREKIKTCITHEKTAEVYSQVS